MPLRKTRWLWRGTMLGSHSKESLAVARPRRVGQRYMWVPIASVARVPLATTLRTPHALILQRVCLPARGSLPARRRAPHTHTHARRTRPARSATPEKQSSNPPTRTYPDPAAHALYPSVSVRSSSAVVVWDAGPQPTGQTARPAHSATDPSTNHTGVTSHLHVQPHSLVRH